MTINEFIIEYGSEHCIPNVSFTIKNKEIKSINIYFCFLNLKFGKFSEEFLQEFSLLKKEFKKQIKNLSHDYNTLSSGMPGVWFASKFIDNEEVARCVYFKVKPFKVLMILYNFQTKKIYKSFYTYIKDKRKVENFLKKKNINFTNKYKHMLELRPKNNGLLDKDKVVVVPSEFTKPKNIYVSVFKKFKIEQYLVKSMRRLNVEKSCEGYDFLNNYKTIYFYFKKSKDLKKFIL